VDPAKAVAPAKHLTQLSSAQEAVVVIVVLASKVLQNLE
jgi:hypothetical protein